MKLFLFSLVVAVTAATVSATPVEKPAPDKVVIGYYSPSDDTKVADLDMSKYTHINYAYGILHKHHGSKPTDIHFDPIKDGSIMRQLVKRGKASGVRILMSIGGWGGSQTFSDVAADASLREDFIDNAMVFVKADENGGYNMDGIDISCVSGKDATNYFLLLKELRQRLNKEFPSNDKLLTAAVRIVPFDNENGTPMKDVSHFAKHLDWISVIAFDIMGPWSSTTGPSAPFTSGDSNRGIIPPYHTFSDGITSWMRAGIPAHKLVAGIAFYGNSVTATVDMNTILHAPRSSIPSRGGPSDKTNWNKYCNEDTSYRGIWKWKELRTNVLVNNSTTPLAGWTRHWDIDTQTPWLFHTLNKTFISYDDVDSLSIKIKHVKAKGLRGVMFREISYDYNNELTTVLNQVRCSTNCPSVATVTADDKLSIASWAKNLFDKRTSSESEKATAVTPVIDPLAQSSLSQTSSKQGPSEEGSSEEGSSGQGLSGEGSSGQVSSSEGSSGQVSPYQVSSGKGSS
ncbi:hypothetical protein BGZ72_001884, partial [Mortierella alpina]